jgi:hypothetical protein
LPPVQVAFILVEIETAYWSVGFANWLVTGPGGSRRIIVSIKTWTCAVAAVVAAFAVLTAGIHMAGGDEAFANQCAAQCYAQENACRKATSDDPKCGAELTKCLQSCRGK